MHNLSVGTTTDPQSLDSHLTGDLVINLAIGCYYFSLGPWTSLVSQPQSITAPFGQYQIILLGDIVHVYVTIVCE